MSDLVENPKDRFSHIVAHMMYNEYQNLKALNFQQLSRVEDIFSNFLRNQLFCN